MRLRIPELLEKRGLTAYGLHVASEGRISLSTAFRLVRIRGELQSFDRRLLEALCDVLRVAPGTLFEYDAARRPVKRPKSARTA